MDQKVSGRWLAAAFCLSGALTLGGVVGAVLQTQPPARAAAPLAELHAAETAPPETAVLPGEAHVSAEEPAGEPDVPPEESPAPVDKPDVPTYDFTRPAPESKEVELDYFDDAAFVGDSRTDGFLIYSGIGRGKNLTSNGLSIFKLGEKKALRIGGEKLTLLEALALDQYGKVYLSLGINELGYDNDERFYDSYCEAIDQIRAIQPDAVIYIQGLIPVNEAAVMASSGRAYLTNEHLRVYNELMLRAAEEKNVVFLDLYSAFVNEDGELPAGASRDGVHLTREYCRRWLDFLRTHTVSPEVLASGETENGGVRQ